jgi:hypothetical protein
MVAMEVNGCFGKSLVAFEVMVALEVTGHMESQLEVTDCYGKSLVAMELTILVAIESNWLL